MEISSNNRIQQAASVYKQQEVNKSKTGYMGKTGEIQKPDSIELSTTSQEISRIKSMITSTPDVREQQVSDLRSQVESGTYNVDSHKIAAAMLQELQSIN